MSDQPSPSLSTPQNNPGPTHPGLHLHIHSWKISAFSWQTGHTGFGVVVVIEVSQGGGNLIFSKSSTPYTKFMLKQKLE